ncbi:MAG: 50S ribosomal protein L7/L12 [Deltaproteobacteria bacterium]|nr:50S ribosomal protein L7/L12 [Deltaproteobacteria bacterium]
MSEPQLSREQVKDYLKNLSLLDAAALVRELEQELGVSAAAPVVAMAGGMAPGAGVAEAAAPVVAMAGGMAPGAGAAEAAAPEKDEFTVMLTGVGDKKIQVIKVVRELTGLGLKEAKELVDGAPKPVKEGVNKAEAEQVKQKLEEVGATVELK